METVKSNRGGKRENAGRKKEQPKKRLSVYVLETKYNEARAEIRELVKLKYS